MTFRDIVTAHDPYDYDKDGVAEIERLRLLPFESASAAVDPDKKLLVVVVEPRLLERVSGARYSVADLLRRLRVMKSDLLQEGFDSAFVELQVMRRTTLPYPGGKVLLAIREFFKSIRQAYPRFAGALLVGSFPDAKLTHIWPEYGDGMLGGNKLKCYREAGFLVARPRFDVIVADLDGNWQSLYRESVALDRRTFFITGATTVALVPGSSKVLLTNPTVVLNEPEQPTPGPVTLYDTFLLRDAAFTENRLPDGTLRVEFDMLAANPEVSVSDRDRPNAIARPDICISRINARSIAVRPPDAAAALDQNGCPQTAASFFSSDEWVRDPALERTLLIEYLDRNHDFRSGAFSEQACSVALLESGLGTVAAEQGVEGWSWSREQQVDGATLLEFVRWLKRPATFRVIAAHADPMCTKLRRNDPDAAAVEAECGGRPWRWTTVDGKLEPSFTGHYTADLYLYRTLWENRQLVGACPSFVLHVGCDVNSVQHPDRPYDDPMYGAFQNAECLLFYANQLAVLGHVTWWNHGPSGFGRTFGGTIRASFGDGWRGFFDTWSGDATLTQNQPDRKRCYEWGIVGDWTLRKYYSGSHVMPARRLIALRTADGHFMTAVNGGGLDGANSGAIAAALNTHAPRIGPWERFRMEWLDPEHQRFALKTVNGNYVSAVGGGGIGGPNDARSPVHTDAPWLGPWEKLELNHETEEGTFAFQLGNGQYLSALNGGGVGGTNDIPIHTDAVQVGPCETFTSVEIRKVGFRTVDGHFLTAVNGGGLGGPNSGPLAVALHTDASSIGPWELFTIEWLDASRQRFALKTVNGQYVTAVNGGGIGGPNDSRSPLHTDALWVGPWEQFTVFVDARDGMVTIQAPNGRYLTAVNGGGFGGPAKVPIHTDATRIGPCETFTFVPCE